MALNSTEEIIADIRMGKMVILVDDEDRENEGDLLIAASLVRPEDINFMAKYGRGLICLTLTERRCEQLKLPLMVSGNKSVHGTNFTVSIEAAEGVSTGISAADRALTVQAAVAPNAKPVDIVQPGHIFPLMAQPGGVLSRAGHTEAGCDLGRLAGLEPAAVIVEIMNDDGSMARRPDLEIFAAEHGLKMGAIADLIHYRLANENTLERTCTREIDTSFGAFKLHTYLDKATDIVHHALVKGELNVAEPVHVRVHAPDPVRDFLTLVEPGAQFSRWTFHRAMEKIEKVGSGVLILLGEGENQGRKNLEVQLQEVFGEKMKTSQPGSEHIQFQQVGAGSQILRSLGVKKMHLLGPPIKYAGISGFDLEVVDYITED